MAGRNLIPGLWAQKWQERNFLIKILTFTNYLKHCYKLGSGFWKIIDSLDVGRDLFFPILLIQPVAKLDRLSDILKFILLSTCQMKSPTHNYAYCPKVINYSVLLRTKEFLRHGTIAVKTRKIPVKLGWVGTSQPSGCSNLDTELSYFMDLPKNHRLTNISWPTFLISFFILLLLRDKYNSLFLGRGVRPPFPKSWHQPFQGPKASASSPSKLITTFLDKNTVFSSGGLLAITVFILSS